MEGQSKFVDFVNNIQEKISQLTTLEIKTIVGDYLIDNKDEVLPAPNAHFLVLHTKIDLIGGDVISHVSRGVMQNEFSWMRELHAEKERKAHEIIENNLKAIKSLFELFSTTKGLKVE